MRLRTWRLAASLCILGSIALPALPSCNSGGGHDTASQPEERITLDLVEGCNPFATSSECIFPYPSAFFQIEDPASATGVRVNYPEGTLPVPPGMPDVDMGPTNSADGVSPAGPLLLHFGRDIHPNHLTGQDEPAESLLPENPIALFNYETGERVLFMSEMDMNRKVWFPGRYALIVRPLEPMEMGARHVAVLTRDLTDKLGRSLASPAAFAALRDGVLTTHEEIEGIRDQYEGIFEFLSARGYAREELLLAWDFMVASDDYLLGSVLSMRQEALAEVGRGGLDYTITKTEIDPNEHIARIVEGEFEVPTYLQEDDSIAYDEDHHPIRRLENRSFPFTMLIPRKAETLGEPLPLILFGHGLWGDGRSYLTGWLGGTIQPLAEEAGAVIVATDWIGLSGGDMELIIEEVVEDFNRISIVTDRLQQSLINNFVLTELSLGPLTDDIAVWDGDHDLIDESRVYYYGVSLGGIQGSSLVSISNRISRAILAVPGSVWLNLIPRSINWVPLKLYVDIFYPDPLLQQMAIAIFQTRFDHSDPINLTRLLYKDPLPDSPPDRTVLLQEAIGDCQVPNLTTEMLARAIGVNLMTPSIYDVFGLGTVTSPTTESALVQYHLVEQTKVYMPPAENVPPTQENMVHSDMCFLPHVVDQVFHFGLTGEIVQPCDGPCDPD